MLIFDIETGPLPETELSALCPPQPAVEPPGEFDPASVKYGNAKNEELRASILAGAKKKHEAAVANHSANLLAAAEQHFADFKSKAALDPTTGRVLAIGFQSADDPAKFSILHVGNGNGNAADDEAELLAKFWAQYSKCRSQPGGPRKMVGHNCLSFDLPFLIRRSWMTGVDVPQPVFDGRYFDRLFIDTRDRWLLGQRWGNCNSSLDHVAKSLGCGQKPDGCDGASFAKLFFGTAEERAAAIAYLRNDLAMTAAVAKRLGVA